MDGSRLRREESSPRDTSVELSGGGCKLAESSGDCTAAAAARQRNRAAAARWWNQAAGGGGPQGKEVAGSQLRVQDE